MKKNTLTENEQVALKNLLQITKTHAIKLTVEEIGNLLVDRDVTDFYDSRKYGENGGLLGIWDGAIYIKNSDPTQPPSRRAIHITKLIPELVSEDMTYHEPLLNLCCEKLGKDWLFGRIVSLIVDKYAITEGQVRALLKKLLGNTMDSTTRSQLHKLKKKILKYKPLVDDFGPLFVEKMRVSPVLSELKDIQPVIE